MLLSMWLQPLRKRDTRKRLLALGLAYLLVCLAAGFAATLPFLGDLSAVLNTDGAINEHALLLAMRGPFITFGLLYVLISALFWHAPALIGWHGFRLPQAFFFHGGLLAQQATFLAYAPVGPPSSSQSDAAGMFVSMGIRRCQQVLLTPSTSLWRPSVLLLLSRLLLRFAMSNRPESEMARSKLSGEQRSSLPAADYHARLLA